MNVDNLFFNGDSFFHKLDGSVKFLLAILWTIVVFSFMDFRIFIFLIVFGFLLIKISGIPLRLLKPVLIFILIFTIFNSIFLLIITPQHGSELTGTYTEFIRIGQYMITNETLFFAFTLSLKYFALLPMSLLFVFTTHPSRFACSLNKIGVPYKIAYSVNLALRYTPDMMKEYTQIKNTLMLKGMDFDSEKNVFKKLINYRVILVPLIKSSLEKIETISNGMDLRGFGLNKKRSWYNNEKYGKREYMVLVFFALAIVIYILVLQKYKVDLYYPF